MAACRTCVLPLRSGTDYLSCATLAKCFTLLTYSFPHWGEKKNCFKCFSQNYLMALYNQLKFAKEWLVCKCIIWFKYSVMLHQRKLMLIPLWAAQQWLLQWAHVCGILNYCRLFFVHHQVKNAGRKLGRRCDMCSNYEKALQAIQGQEAETRDQVSVWAPSAACWCVSRNEPLFSRWRNCRWCCGRPMSSWRGRWLTNRSWKIPFKQPTKKLLQRFQSFFSFVYIYSLTTFLAYSYLPVFPSGYIHFRSESQNCWKCYVVGA